MKTLEELKTEMEDALVAWDAAADAARDAYIVARDAYNKKLEEK